MGWRDLVPSPVRRSALWTLGHQLREDPYLTLQRRRIWPAVLRTPPVHTRPVESGAPVELHLMCCERDYLSAFWALKSFFRASGVEYPIVVHFHGAMSTRARRAFTTHFPQARLVSQEEADREVERQLRARGFRQLLDARRRSPIMMKLTDVALIGSAPGIVCVDSDVLFFDYPSHLVMENPPADSIFMRDIGSGYAISSDVAHAALGVQLAPEVNCGIMAFARDAVSLDRCESFLERLALPTYDGLIEQTLYALCASERGRVQYLPRDYVVSLRPGLDGVTARHYAGSSRPLLTTEGMRYLLKRGFEMKPPRSADKLSVLESKKPPFQR
jgi:hypothetical protein